MKTILGLFALLLLVIGAIAYTQHMPIGGLFNAKNKNPNIVIDNHIFTLLVAQTDQEKNTGLSNKTTLPKDTGMLFIFNSPLNIPFWMKNMKFPIDIIFIADNKILRILSNVPIPAEGANDDEIPKYTSLTPYNNVLEITAGLAKEYKFKVGDSVKIENL